MCNSIRQATVICMLFSFILVEIMGEINASVCELVFSNTILLHKYTAEKGIAVYICCYYKPG